MAKGFSPRERNGIIALTALVVALMLIGLFGGGATDTAGPATAGRTTEAADTVGRAAARQAEDNDSVKAKKKKRKKKASKSKKSVRKNTPAPRSPLDEPID